MLLYVASICFIISHNYSIVGLMVIFSLRPERRSLMPQHRAPTNGPHASNGPPRFNNGPSAAGPTRYSNGPAAAAPSRFSNGSAAAAPSRSNNAPSQPQSNAPRRPDKLTEIRKNVRSLLATEKKGLDAMRFVNNYQELTIQPFYDAIRQIGYNTVTDFCNDNLDCIDYEVSLPSGYYHT